MTSTPQDPTQIVTEVPEPARPPRRRISVVRTLLALAGVAALAFGVFTLVSHLLEDDSASSDRWFAPYVDVTLPPYSNFQDPASNPSEDVVLAFVVADPEAPCSPSWGAAYDLDEAASELDLDRRIVRLRERGGDVIVSFGGVANDELAGVCDDVDALTEAYRSVIERYQLAAVDLDIEGAALGDTEANQRRAEALATLQAEATAKDRRLDVWLTVPMAPHGLLPEGEAAIDSLLDGAVTLTGVNVMAMEYGESRSEGTSFVEASLAGIDKTAGQLRSAYERTGLELTAEAAYAQIGVTPMIGQNFFPADRLETADARSLYDQASARGVLRFSMWSLNRDVACGGNVDPMISDNLCSGVAQDPLEFSTIFGNGGGRATSNDAVTNQEAMNGRDRQRGADGVVGPYHQWRPRREYDQAEKITWRGQVYEAKWWNVGAQPDGPVEHDWESPWRVLGPVLEDDGPPPTPPTIPEGSYPVWEQKEIYDTGDRVMHQGVGYRAQWWTRGDDPTDDVDNGWESPWELVGPPSQPSGEQDEDSSTTS